MNKTVTELVQERNEFRKNIKEDNIELINYIIPASIPYMAVNSGSLKSNVPTLAVTESSKASLKKLQCELIEKYNCEHI